MRYSWNEIKIRAAAFSREYASATYEKGETQSFYNDFFKVFGVKRSRVALFERQVTKLNNKQGFIDLFWPGVLLVEQKSAGRDLTKAKTQAEEYCLGLKDDEIPRYILLSDFKTFELYDLEENLDFKFDLTEFSKNVEKFGFIIGVHKKTFRDQDPVNIKASELMGRVHDSLEDSGYTGHSLERFLVRLLFCLFADDTGIFEPRGIFETLIKERTSEDGADLGQWISLLFDVLNTPEGERYATLDEDLNAFPYINGDLFKERLPIPAFNSKMRAVLIEACEFSWEAISPAIFGSLFQSVMNRTERRNQGAHYTTEKNILKVVHSLFLGDLLAEFEKLKSRKTQKKSLLQEFHLKLSKLKFFDPACGCGNFLIIVYRELRILEIELLKELREDYQLQLDISGLSKIDVDQFYGIEINEFPGRIAEVAMWMMDHIMNTRLGLEFGKIFVRIPLRKSANIAIGNALKMDWQQILEPNKCNYVMGNPPFIGHQYRSSEQKADMEAIWGKRGQFNRLDYVSCWFKKAIDYSVTNPSMRIAYVATNSITMGEQCGILWPEVFKKGFQIFFAHRTFQWNSEARGPAAVHCVIIGITQSPVERFVIYDYDDIKADPHESQVNNINGYLIDGPQYSVPSRSKPQNGYLKLHKGSQPTDGARIKDPNGGYVTYSNLILEESDKIELLKLEPKAKDWLRPYVGGDELISGVWRWCLWLKDVDPKEYKNSKPILERLARVKAGRLQSPTESVQNAANTPMLFTQDRQPSKPYLAIPEVSSQTRYYVPIDILKPNIIASNKLQIIPGADLLYFGMLSSAMHMAWMRAVGGRLKSDYSYSPAIYNSFSWPSLSEKQKENIKALSAAIIECRKNHQPKSLEELYDSDWMPADLRQKHKKLDDAVDKAYRNYPFQSERERIQHLFLMIEKQDPSIKSK